MNFKIDTLGKKIGFGYALMTIVLAFAVIATIWQVRTISATSDQLMNVRQPSARADLELLNGINRSIAEIRGWVLLKKDTFKIGRKATWKSEIRPALITLEELSRSWSNPENTRRLTSLIPMIDQMERYQNQVEELAQTDEDAAVALMDDKMLPLNKEIRDTVELLMQTHELLMLEDFTNISNQIFLLSILEWILLVAGLLISIFLALYITRSITTPVSGAVEVAENIGAGNLQTSVDVGGSTELEKLGAALREMRDSLIRKTEETQRYDWLTSGQNQLNEKMRGDLDIQELANNITSFLAGYVAADIGSLYLLDDGSHDFELTGRYAFSTIGDGRKTFALNEGLIGQAAHEKRQLILADLSADHIRITSSIIEAVPGHLMVTPFLFEGATLGVIELGRLTSFTEIEKEFIRSCMEGIGMSLNSAIARKKIQELLEETQVQSEELQSQQEELRQVNEELEEQAQNLKQQHEELQVANEELEEQTQALELKNTEIENARDDVEQKSKQLEISSKYKSEFLANMSHELRTPLNSLLILSKDLSENKGKNLNEDQVESAEIIHRSGQDLLTLINEVLDLSKIEAGKMSLDVKKVELKTLVSEMERAFRLQAKQKGLVLDFELAKDLPAFISTDSQRLNQIMRNLLSNAIKFTQKGSVTVSIKSHTKDHLSISVADTGIGIPENKQKAVFEAFQQGDGGTSRKYGGTGLGLSISRELAKLLNGELSLTSKQNQGSTFTLVIPTELLVQSFTVGFDKSPTTDVIVSRFMDNIDYTNYPSLEDDRDVIEEKDQVVLIIEDDLKFARVVFKQAHSKGFKVLSASSGEDGLILAEKFLPHAIILDLDLPGINGYRVLTLLKSNPKTRHIPVHIMSVEEKTIDPIKEGAVEYLTKPIDKKGLDGAFSRIENFIDRKMKNLLIIEDDKNARRAMQKLIGNGDVKCFEAGTGKEALDILKNHPIDCIVLDIGLPDISGFRLIEKFEKMKKGVPPIIVYTGRELTREENAELLGYAESIIIKGVKSEERLLDETALFLHRTITNLPETKQRIIENLYDKDAMFNGKKVILADDDMRNVFALSKILKERGMEVIKAENGKMAIEKLEEYGDTDIVLMDIMMPEMDGYEAMRTIRSKEHFRKIPIIALTAKAMKDDKQKCIDAGANDYIAKPIDTDRLLSLMSVWLTK